MKIRLLTPTLAKAIAFIVVFACVSLAVTFTVFAVGREGVIVGRTTPTTDKYLDEGSLGFSLTANSFYDYTGNLIKRNTNYFMRGWVWNYNLGWVSLYCKDGWNSGRPCGNTNYNVTINGGTGAFSGWAYGDNVGWISFACSGGVNGENATYPCGAVNYSLKLNTSTSDANGYISVLNTGKYAWSDNVGWINFTGVKFPWLPCQPADYLAGGACYDGDQDGCGKKGPRWNADETFICGGDCDDNDATVCPGSGCGGSSPQCELEDECSSGGGDDEGGDDDGGDFTDIVLPDLEDIGGIKIRGGISSGYLELSDSQSLGQTSGMTSFSAVQSIMRKNAVTLLKGVPSQTNLEISKDEFLTKDVVYIDGDYVYKDYPAITGIVSTLSEPKTLVVDGADLFIDGNILGGVGKFGIIVLRDLSPAYGKNVGGNVYIHSDVKNIQANIYAEGSVFTYDGDTSRIYGDDGTYRAKWQCRGLYGEPDWSGVYENLTKQLFIQGSLVSRNSLGKSDADTLPIAEGACSVSPCTCDGQESSEAYVGQAELYDLKWLRTGPVVEKATGIDPSDGSFAVIINYIAPKGIPGFDGIGTSASSFGGF